MSQPQGDRTRSVHGPQPHGRGSLTTPILQTSTFALESADDVDAVYEGRRTGDVYARFGNPTVAAVEARMAQLEGTEAALVSASGMAAISTTFFAFVNAGGRIVATQDQYGGTLRLLEEMARRFRVRVDFVDGREPDALREALREPADLVYIETPTNPTLRVVDLRTWAAIAREAGVVSMADSTFATPYNTKPHELGIDLVMHAATKYLGGHSDLMAGVVCGSKAHVQRVATLQRLFGPVLDPHAAFLLERGLKTMPLRVEAANANAQRVAEHLEAHPLVQRVHYPGLPSHPQHELAKRQMRGFGGLLSFDLASFAQARRFLDGLKLVRNAASLGGVESLCSLPLQQSHRNQPEEVLHRSGIVPGTVRLALGIEDAEDLVADVDQALKAAAQA